MARNGKVTAWTVVSIVFGAVFIAACIVLVLTTRGSEQTYDDYKNDTTAVSADTSASDETTASTDPALPENPINFDSLRSDYPDAVAWIKVAGTPIDYPVVCSDESELYLCLIHI